MRVSHRGGEMHVDPAAVSTGLGKAPAGVARKQASRAPAIAAEISQGSAAQGAIPADIVFPDPGRESRADVLQGSDRPIVDQAPYERRLGMMAIHEPFNAYQAGTLGDVKGARCIFRPKGERFL